MPHDTTIRHHLHTNAYSKDRNLPLQHLFVKDLPKPVRAKTPTTELTAEERLAQLEDKMIKKTSGFARLKTNPA